MENFNPNHQPKTLRKKADALKSTSAREAD